MNPQDAGVSKPASGEQELKHAAESGAQKQLNRIEEFRREAEELRQLERMRREQEARLQYVYEHPVWAARGRADLEKKILEEKAREAALEKKIREQKAREAALKRAREKETDR